MLIIDSLAYASRFRNIHPGKKIVLALALLFLTVVMQNIVLGFILIIVMGMLSIWGGGTPFKLYLRLMKIPMFFIVLSLVAIIANITLNPPSISVSAEGIRRGATLAVSALGAVSCLYFLALSTPLTDIFYVLEKIKCPYLVIELMLLIYRFVFLLWSIAGALNKAVESRLGNVGFRTAINTAGQVFATLFVRALRRSSAIYDSMESRGYNGVIHVLPGFQSKKQEEKQDGENHV